MITVPYTWVSTVEVIKQVGATPVFVDISLYDMCIDPEEVSKKISKKTKAIIGVDLYGNVCDIDELKKFNIPVIQDSAQSTGAYYKGKRVGGIANLTCFSFYPAKNLGAFSDAGIITTNNKKYCAIVKSIRNYGENSFQSYEKRKYINHYKGLNSRMSEINGSILIHKLAYLKKDNENKKKKALYY